MSEIDKPILFGAGWCGFCHTLETYLEQESIDYQYKNVDEKINEDEMLRYTEGKYLIPTLVVGGRAYQNPVISSVKELLKNE